MFVCTVTDFSAAETGSGVKLCMLVRLLSVMNSPILAYFGLAAAPQKPIYKSHLRKNRTWLGKKYKSHLEKIVRGEKFAPRVSEQSELGAVWWDMRLACKHTRFGFVYRDVS